MERIEFEDSTASDFDRNSVFLRLATEGAKSVIEFDAGYNEVELQDETRDGFLARFTWSRDLSANGTFDVSLGTEYATQGDVFEFYQDNSADIRSTVDVVRTDEPFVNTYASVGYTLGQDRYSVSIAADWNEEDYEGDDTFDRDVFRGRIALRRDITRTLFVEATGSYARRQFQQSSQRDDDIIVGLSAGYRFTDGLSLTLEYLRYEREDVTAANSLVESRAFARLNYIPTWSR